MIQSVIRQLDQVVEVDEADNQEGASNELQPHQTVLGAFFSRPRHTDDSVLNVKDLLCTAGSQGPPEAATSSSMEQLPLRTPPGIQDIPFRRQDLRELNARQRMMADRRLYKCLLAGGLATLVIGLILITIFVFEHNDLKWAQPLAVVGSVVGVGGLVIVLFSMDIYFRYRRRRSRVPSSDDVYKGMDLHLIKHWVDPGLIPFGWGHLCQEDLEMEKGPLKGAEREPSIAAPERSLETAIDNHSKS